MEPVNLTQVMDEFYEIVNNTPPEDALAGLMRRAGTYDNVAALEAMALLLIVENARRRHAEARLGTRLPPERTGGL